MADEDVFHDADKLLAGMDFAAMKAEQDELHQRQTAALLRSLLGVVDSLGDLEAHCRDLVEAGHDRTPRKSVELIRRQLLRVLSETGVEPMKAVGSPLDLDLHEVAAVRVDSSTDDVVLEEPRPGYMWRESCLRRAKVVVSQRQSEDGPAGNPQPER